MPTGTLLTIDDYERLPAEVAEHHELVNGELVEVSGNTPRHNFLRDRLLVPMLPLNGQPGAGTITMEQEYDFEGNAHAPDISFFGPAKRALVDLDRRVQRFVPDLAIEIASPSDTYEGLLLKKERYLKAGTSEVWLISPQAREIVQYTKDRVVYFREKGQLQTDLLPGILIDVEDLFRGL